MLTTLKQLCLVGESYTVSCMQGTQALHIDESVASRAVLIAFHILDQECSRQGQSNSSGSGLSATKTFHLQGPTLAPSAKPGAMHLLPKFLLRMQDAIGVLPGGEGMSTQVMTGFTSVWDRLLTVHLAETRWAVWHPPPPPPKRRLSLIESQRVA